MTDAVVRVENLVKRYGDVVALGGVSFVVRRGEIFGLLGPNGAGKTTALHILLGVLTPTEGRARLLDRSPVDDRAFLYPRINFSSAYVQMPFNLTARQNLDIYARLYGVADRPAVIEGLLDKFQLRARADHRTGQLSAGEQTRLNICKSLLNNPELLFLDEPTASLDPDISDLVRRTLKERQEKTGLTIVYTSHNMSEVESLCDRVLFIHRGRKISEGTPGQVRDQFQKESLEKVFIHLARSGDVLEDAGAANP